MYITKPVWSHVLALRLWTLKKAHITIPDCIRYIIGVFCCNFKSQMNSLCQSGDVAYAQEFTLLIHCAIAQA